jgi:hypothetical protein
MISTNTVLHYFIKSNWAGYVVRMGKGKVYRILVGKPGGKGPLGKPRRRWANNIKKHLREIQWGGIDWIDLV